ncbi:MAG: DUF6495 family protein [Salegentibacter sp.]|uniref:Histidyl-tRNA synthetase n=1 Tax=Salegentibacter flavus TaxID=287099 RepID=A0A1I4YJV4_9FLAO|nr:MULTISPECIES: DUF6495 family protein [Salegentibacter]MDR9456139.1 DUF6495 family protein [Salegentibacter sp.]SFN38361.1 hypothetical protein SAMN05660413_00800 [Salegentibacter flavus]
MKYARLTKEQFEEMHQEFINFLASQSITAEEWQDIKVNKPDVAEQELDVFSDLVWEAVLNKVEYLEHFSPNQIFLFQITAATINLIAIKIENEAIDLRTKEGYNWLQGNLLDESVNIYTSTKAISDDRNKDIFALIQQGANITKGELYTYFEKVVN